MSGAGLVGRVRVVCTLAAALVALSACPRTKSHEPDAGARSTTDAGIYLDSGGRGTAGGSGGSSAESPRCRRVVRRLAVEHTDKLDLLLVVDNSNSMAGEQAALRAQFPKLIQTLATGLRSQDDPEPFPPIKDMHVGVVSTDMGIPGVELPPSCHADGGDDGRLQNNAHGVGCDEQYPSFLSFTNDPRLGPVANPEKFASDMGCIAQLGTGGCGIEMPLEAAFKAVWPKILADANGNMVDNPYRFIATVEDRTWGNGDSQTNRGFLRNDFTQGQSLLAVVVVTDEEDCSVKDTSHLRPNNQLPQDSPFRMEDFNLRCFYHKEYLYDLEQRYYRGFRALRRGHEDKFVFAAIAGVPADLTQGDAITNVDFASDDPASRDAFYNAILSDERMSERVDPSSKPGSGSGDLVPSCVRAVPGEDSPTTAFPPRRLVELAKLFGKSGTVQSICQDDLGPAADAIIVLIASHLHQPCLARAIKRQPDGKIPCDVVWELPPVVPSGSATPTECSELSFLSPVDADSISSDANGSVSCTVAQLAATNTRSGMPPAGEGWFYDDFTEERAHDCRAHEPQRITFSGAAKPPAGVTVKLVCRSPLAEVAANGSNPSIGSACDDSGDEQCLVTLPDDSQDRSLFCHPELRACTRSCTADAQCPPGWKCKTDGTDRPFCVHPECGE